MLNRALRVLELGILSVWRAPDVPAFEVVRHRLTLPGLESGLRVAHLTDLHFGPVQRLTAVRAWVDATLALEPDTILITGDFLEDERALPDLSQLCAELERLHAPLGVFAVLGNHDYGAFGSVNELHTLTDALESVGIRVLVNQGFWLRQDVYVAGLDDLWLGQPDLEQSLRNAPKNAALILLSHHPDVLPSVPPSVALTLSGHTHGGQVVLPVVGPVHTGSKYRARFAAGFVRGDLGALGFVSRGLGTTALPLRYGCPAELVLLELECEGLGIEG